MCSVVTGQKNGCDGSIRLRDDPEDHAIIVRVGREKPQAEEKSFIVSLTVFFINFTPIADDVAVECELHFDGRYGGDDSRGGCKLANRKQRMGQ